MSCLSQPDVEPHWKCARDGEVPEGAVHSGQERGEETQYVARAWGKDEYGRDVLLPGKLVPKHKKVVTCYGDVYENSEYEVRAPHQLLPSYFWVAVIYQLGDTILDTEPRK